MPHDIQQLLKDLENNHGAKQPPVHLWQPEIEGVIDIQIDSQMHWTHEGGYFERQSIQRLLSRLLRKDGDDYYLVTPQEKLKICVADVPFEIISMTENNIDNSEIILITDVEDIIRLGEGTAWELRQYQGNPVPYIEVRNNLWARVSRAVYYQMIELAEISSTDNSSAMTITSNGKQFSLGECLEN